MKLVGHLELEPGREVGQVLLTRRRVLTVLASDSLATHAEQSVRVRLLLSAAACSAVARVRRVGDNAFPWCKLLA